MTTDSSLSPTAHIVAGSALILLGTVLYWRRDRVEAIYRRAGIYPRAWDDPKAKRRGILDFVRRSTFQFAPILLVTLGCLLVISGVIRAFS